MSIAIAAVLVSGCERDLETEGVTKKITYYAVIKPLPDPTTEQVDLVLNKGDNFSDPGVLVTENGAAIDYETSIAGTYFERTAVDTSIPDFYSITYSATNVDGYKGSASRSVFVIPENGNLVTSIEGLYTSTVKRSGVAGAQYTNMEYVIIAKTGANTYEISDGIGGYYDIGRAYTPTFAAVGGKITAVSIPGNQFTFGPSFPVRTFGGAVTLTSMDVNPAEKKVHFTSTWDAGYTFDVVLTQVEF